MTESANSTEVVKVKKCGTLGILAIVFWVLAFIPFIGWLFLLIALVLVIIDVVQHKKNAICGWIGLFIAIAAIILKVIAIIGLINVGKVAVNKVMEEIPKAVAEEMLPAVIVSIEDYKTQNGAYPTALNELQMLWDGVYESTIDPLAMKDMFVEALTNADELENANLEDLMKQYEYELKGNGYTLFSRWLDWKIGTSDDVYPLSTLIPAWAGFVK